MIKTALETLYPGLEDAIREHMKLPPKPIGPPNREFREGELPQSLEVGYRFPEVESDMIDHPPHYNQTELEPIDVIETWQLDYHLGNTVKYIARARFKGKELEDLKKACWYLTRKIAMLEKNLGVRKEG